MKARTFSLSTVRFTLTNNNGLTFKAGGNYVAVGGEGQLVNTVSYEYTSDFFEVEGSADGGYATSFNKNRSGRISLTLQQTSPKVTELMDFIKQCVNNPTNAESTITISDDLGNINITANGCFPAKFPGNSVSSNISNRTFDFKCGEIINEEDKT